MLSGDIEGDTRAGSRDVGAGEAATAAGDRTTGEDRMAGDDTFGEEDDTRGAKLGIDLAAPPPDSERRMSIFGLGRASGTEGFDLSNERDGIERDSVGRDERSILAAEAAGARDAG